MLALAREFNVLGATATIMQFSEMTPACAAESATTTTTMTLMTTKMAMTMTMMMTMIITMMIMIITMMTTLDIVSTAVPASYCIRKAIKLIKPTKRKFEVGKVTAKQT